MFGLDVMGKLMAGVSVEQIGEVAVSMKSAFDGLVAETRGLAADRNGMRQAFGQVARDTQSRLSRLEAGLARLEVMADDIRLIVASHYGSPALHRDASFMLPDLGREPAELQEAQAPRPALRLIAAAE